MLQHLSFKIAGEAGFGIKEAGLIFSRVLLNQNYFVFDYSEYPSLIRGGHNTYQATFSNQKLDCFYSKLDLLIALDQQTIDSDIDQLLPNGVLIFDPTVCKIPESLHRKLVPVPLQEIVKQAQAPEITKNTVALGAAMAIIDLPLSALFASLSRSFEAKGEAVLRMNHLTAQEGFNFVKNNFPAITIKTPPSEQTEPRLFLTANDAMSLAAIASGAKAYFAYPMTPASSILHNLAKMERAAGMVVKQSEDEIAAINQAIGASFAGIRCAVGTSGGGFALMVEALGLAAITETPLVVFEVQRPGPATGVPTWTGQADLNFVRHSAPGDFLRMVVAPGDVEEAFHLTTKAFNLADKYQIPVIVLTDKLLAESRQTVTEFDHKKINIDQGNLVKNSSENYQRYANDPSGISPRALPDFGQGLVKANSDEHDFAGYSTEDAQKIEQIVNKRARKVELLKKELPPPTIYGPQNAELTIVSWGSTKLAVNQALQKLKNDSVNHLHLTCLEPLPPQTKLRLEAAKNLVVIEGNQTGQLASLLQEKTGVVINDRINKYNGRPFYPEEIEEKVSQMLKLKAQN